MYRLVIIITLVVFAPRAGWGQKSFFQKAAETPNVDSAIHYINSYIDFAKDRHDTLDLIEANCLLARKLTIKSLYTRAAKTLEKCLGFHFVKNNRALQGKLYLELGTVYCYEGEYALSLNDYQKAGSIFEKLSLWNGLVRCNAQMAEYYRKLAKFDEADHYIKDALENYARHQLSDTTLLIYIYNRSAAIANESNPDPMVTIRNSRMALKLAVKSKNKDAEATSLNELGYTYKNIKKNDSAEILYKKAEVIWFSMGANREALHAMNNRVMLYSHNGYAQEKIVGLYNDMIGIVKRLNVEYPLNDAYGYLSEYYGHKGDSAKAFGYFYLYHQSIINDIARRNDIQITNLTERYENEKAKKEVKRMSGELSDSIEKLEQKNTEAKRMYFFIAALMVLLVIIAVLLVRINRTNKTLAYRNREKDVLIQEIHHRVKNNLQFISSLINMQMNTSVDDREIHTLNDASRRIRAIALVHEMLYNHKDAQGISIKQYLEELVLSLDQLVNSEKIPIAFRMNLEDENFNVSDSIALGMITSELVSNSMKHAFKNIKDPQIEIELQKQQNNVRFVVRDNGIGVHDENGQRKTLGLRLIDIFSRQLKGKYTVSAAKGYCYELHFKAK